MKSSNYNILFDHNGKKLAFNSMTCALAEVNDKFFRLLNEIEHNNFHEENLSEEDLSVLENMKKGGFITDDCFDEIEFLKFKSYQGKFKTDSLGLTIAPTFACNFACPYCYESTRNEIMSQDVMDAVCNEVQKAAERKKNVHISWYGGEPLLAKNVIWNLSEQFLKSCETTGTYYSAAIVTNGYLIDDETVNNFLKYKINKVQITIDGPPDIHNNRRKLKNSSKPTFDITLKNVKKVLDSGINVAIRINVDKTNEERVEELLDILLDYKLENAYVYLGHVQSSTEACQSISGDCLTTKDYALKFVDFEKTLIEKGFNPNNYPSYPRARSNNCGADAISSKVIAPDGSLYKCWHDMSDKNMSIGNIKDMSDVTDKNIMTQVNYLLFTPFKNEECLRCNVLPLCMGGCPTVSNSCSCQKWKYGLIESLKAKYEALFRSVKA